MTKDVEHTIWKLERRVEQYYQFFELVEKALIKYPDNAVTVRNALFLFRNDEVEAALKLLTVALA